MRIAEIEVDSRGRASLNSAGITTGRYRVTRNGDSFQLTPVTSYTEAEILALSNTEIQQAHQRARSGATEFVTSSELP